MNIDFKIDGITILIGLGLVAAGIIYLKKEEIKTALDPTDKNNLAHSAATDAINYLGDSSYEGVGEWAYDTRASNPIAWLFEGYGRLTGDIPPGGY